MIKPNIGLSVLDRTGLKLGSCGTEDHRTLFIMVNDSSGRGKMHYALVEKASAVCRECPILDSCRRYIENEEEVYGMWAGVYYDRSRHQRSMEKWS